MASEGAGSSGKRPIFVDLDRPIEEDCVQTDEALALQSSNPSTSSSKRAKKPPNPDWPPLEYTHEARAIGVQFYERRRVRVLRGDFIDKNEDGYFKLLEDLRHEIESKLDASEKLNNYCEYWLTAEWLDGMVKSLTTNIVTMWRYVRNKKEDESNWTLEDKEVASKLLMVQKWCQGFSHSRNRKKAPWMQTKENEVLDHCTSGSFKWLESSVKVVPMPGSEAEGAYGTVRKVRLTKLGSIPSWMEFAGKKLKTKNEKEKRQEIINEAGACPVKHPGIIRLAYLHPKTMEGYSLWWNGGSLHHFLAHFNSKISETVDNDDIVKQTDTGLNPQALGWVAAYRKNRVNLALSLLVIMGKCHDANYIHNDLSPSNVLLHFDPWKEHTVYIGICDWGISSRVVEKEPSKYGFQTMQQLQHIKDAKKFVAPELFYTFGASDSENSLEVQQKKHLYSMEADAYATGWIAERIWNQDWDTSYFLKTSVAQYVNLRLKLKSLQTEEVRQRASISDVLDTLRQDPYNWVMPECCYRR